MADLHMPNLRVDAGWSCPPTGAPRNRPPQ